jgi:hypothetical protein
LIWRELSDCLSDKIGFRMRRRITIGVYGIHGRENDVVIQDQKGTERMVAIGTGLAGKSNRLSNELLVNS